MTSWVHPMNKMVFLLGYRSLRVLGYILAPCETNCRLTPDCTWLQSLKGSLKGCQHETYCPFYPFNLSGEPWIYPFYWQDGRFYRAEVGFLWVKGKKTRTVRCPPCFPSSSGGAMRALYAYSPLEDSWCLVTQLSHERASCGIAPCNNRLYITGGRDEKNEVIATVLCWDPEAQKLTEECVLPRGVSHHGSVTIRKSYTHIRRIVPGAVSVWLRKGTRCRGSTLCTCCPGSCH